MTEVNKNIYKTVELLAAKFIGAKIQFVFAGSVSTLLQGCKIAPNDIDILVSSSEDVEEIVHLFPESLLEEPVTDETSENWFASRKHPLLRFTDVLGNKWTFSRIIINGIKVEVANINPNEKKEYVSGSGIWENGPQIWSHIRLIPFRNMVVPVIPLEIQLETNLNRNEDDRVLTIINTLRINGFNIELLDYALSEENRCKISEALG